MSKMKEQLETIVTQILISARTEKKADENAFEILFDLLDSIKQQVYGKEFISRNLTGLLFFLYTSLSGEVQNSDYKNPLFMQTAKLEGYLDEIFWESPFKR